MLKKTTIASAVSAALVAGMCLGSVAYAQSSEGSLFGRANAGAVVTITSIETGTTRQTTASSDGSFNFSRLAPGKYRVSSGGQTRDVDVLIGSGTEVALQAAARVEVVASRVRNSIDVSTVESNTVFTQEDIQALPVSRSIEAVALLAPGTVRGDPGLGSGSLPSFGGASVAENGYYINGFDVTNIRNFLSYATLPFDAIAQQQIKTGGYGAEYGRSLGGVISLVTKRGTNQWKFGASAYLVPSDFREPGRDVMDKDPSRAGLYYIFQSANKADTLNYNLYAGGPIVKDKLFIFALLDGRDDKSSSFGQSQSTAYKNTKPNGMIKIDFTPTDKHALELTAIENKTKYSLTDYTSAKPYSTSHDGAGKVSEVTGGGDVTILKYTGYLTDKLTVSALAGRVNDFRGAITGARTAGSDCPVVLDVNLADLGCWTPPFPGVGGRDPLAPPDKDTRDAFRFDLEYAIGNHTIRAGIDNQKFVSSEAGGSAYTGGVYWRYYLPTVNTNVRGQVVPAGTPYVRGRIYKTTSGSFAVENSAMYIEDSWNVTKNVMLYAGLRSESFNNKNAEDQSFVKADNLLAPRLGGSWNVNGDSSLKVYANAGRYFIPVASNTNIRMTRSETFTETFYTYNGRDPRTAAPVTLGPQIGTQSVILDGRLPDPGTVSDTQLRPMNQDEFILGFQKAAKQGFVYGVKAISRKINAGMDDYCDHTRVAAWIKANVKSTYVDSLAPCMLMNPGQDLNIKVDLNGDGTLTNQTIPASALGLAAYTRSYNALQFTLERPNDGRWGMQASYTYAKSKGTAEGYVQSQLNQEDAGVTQDFDFGSFTDGSDGYLPNDRRHVIKIFGNVSLNPEFRVGANLTVASGRPLSCVGFVPPTVPDYAGASAYSSASSYYCLQSTTEGAKLVQRGSVGRTPWTNQLDLQFSYQPSWAKKKLTLQADVFNVFNNQEVIEQQEVRDYSRATSVGAPYTLNANYGQPTGFQSARAVRLTARYEF